MGKNGLKKVSFVRYILHAKKTAFIVEHDFIMATYLADRVIVFDGQPSVEANANAYVTFSEDCSLGFISLRLLVNFLIR